MTDTDVRYRSRSRPRPRATSMSRSSIRSTRYETHSLSPSLTRRPLRKPLLGEADTPSSSPARDEFSRRQKIRMINRALFTDPFDITTLKQLAISRGGLLSDELRCKAWPKLLQIDVDNIPEKPDAETLQGHRDYQQVVLDVNRSLKRFPPGMEESLRMSYQDQLVECIMRVLVYHPELHYYQGYHDIVVTFLLVVGEDLTFAIMDQLSTKHLRDFMYPTMDRTSSMLNYFYPLLGKASSKLREYMEKADVGTVFSLSWLITWYGHVLNDFTHIVRLYDFFIACNPLMPIYLGVAIVLYREKEVLDCECEMCFIHSLLSKIPDDLPLERLVKHAGDLFIQHPPENLADEAKYYSEAALKKKEEQERQRAEMLAMAKARRNQPAQSKGWFLNSDGSLLVHVTIWTLTAAFSAAVYMVYTAGNRTAWPWWAS